jgi:hypothetical protein
MLEYQENLKIRANGLRLKLGIWALEAFRGRNCHRFLNHSHALPFAAKEAEEECKVKGNDIGCDEDPRNHQTVFKDYAKRGKF